MENIKTAAMKSTLKNIAFVCIISLFIINCSVRKSNPTESIAIKNAMVRNGQIQYMNHCQKCHPNGEGGLGPALNSNPAPGFIKRFQVRHGLGVMPAFKKNEISNEDLHAIIKYLSALKHS